MGERKRKAVEVIGDVAKKAKDAVMVPLHGAYALAKAVVGKDDERGSGEQKHRPRGDEPKTATRPSDTGTTPGTDDSPTSGASDTGAARSSGATAETSTSTSSETEQAAEEDAELEDIWGVGASRADDLRDAGFDSVQDVADASTDALTEVSGIGDSTADKMIDSAKDLV